MDLDARRVVQHLQVLEDRLPDLVQVLQTQERNRFKTGCSRPKVKPTPPPPPTCLEFWFSILVLTSGCSVKSGAKYSKYSEETEVEMKKKSHV